jgi:hypothetical protein
MLIFNLLNWLINNTHFNMKYFCPEYFRIILLFAVTLNLHYVYSANCYSLHSGDSINYIQYGTDTLAGIIKLVREINGIKVYQYVYPGSAGLTNDSVLIAAGGDMGHDEFEILHSSPYNESNPIPSGINLPEGLIFRIQLGVYSKPVSFDAFGGLFPVSYEETKGLIKYYTGIFGTSEKAKRALEKVRDYGFSDSFIVPFYNGRKISIEKAKEIEYTQIKL